MTAPFAVEARGLGKRYGDTVAVDDASFAVPAGEIFGLLGPNGAGKTTTIECFATLRSPDRGSTRVLGLDPVRDAAALRPRIGVQLQTAAVPDRLKLWEAVDLFSSFYPRRADWRRLLERLGLADSARVPFARLSGGQRQRAFVALALINEPDVVFLDELTTALDPHARRAIWELIEEIRAAGTTVVLTTHFMEEAERLCDRVAIMHHGRIIALDAPASLIRASGRGDKVLFKTDEAFELDVLTRVVGIERVERDGDRIVVHGRSEGLVGDVVARLAEVGVRCLDIETRRSTLEDVFLDLTGRRLGDE